MKVTNKEVIQSYLLTAARYDFSVYEKRILYRLIELCQAALEGQKLNSDFQINRLLFDDMREIVMPVGAFLKDEKDENYTLAKKALLSLNDKIMEYEDAAIWKPIRLIELPKLDKKGYVKFVLHNEIYEALLDFSKGYRKYELKTAMSFDTIYAMRFYELLSGKKEAITYRIDALKIMFQLENKYKLNTDFLKYVIDVSKAELDLKAPYSFTYTKQKEGKKVVALTFTPYEIKQNRDPEAVQAEQNRQLSIGWLDKIYVDYLEQNYMFERQEIKSNLDTFMEASKKLDLLKFLALKKRAASEKKNPKGWIVNAIKKELNKQ